MIDLHYWTTPNGHKITMFLEETALKYKIFPVNIGKGDQFKPDFLTIAPNNRIPAMLDHEPKGSGNWIKTVPGKGWFPIFRFYGPTEAFFDQTWALNDIEAQQ